MVFVKDFRRDFYDIIQNKRVLVLVGQDVDALCSCRILQYLFKCDQVLYTIVPVGGLQDFERAYIENSEGVQFVVLLNCGATIDVVETLQPEANVVFYICDNHRPVDVHNIYNQVQVKLLMRQTDFEDVPEFEKVFKDEESDDDSGHDSDGSEPSGKRQRITEEVLEKRMARRKWEEERTKALFEYTEFSGYGTSSSMLLYEMAWKMSKDTNDLLWLSIIGVTEQYLNQKIERDKYMDDITQLQSHVSRLNHRPDDEENTQSVDCLKLSFDQELQLSLYRHWSLFESLGHSEYTSCKFKVWTMKGKKRLHEFLADMGLPLVQCKQKFVSMDINCKEEIKDTFKKYLEKYSLTEADMFLPSFQAQYGYKNRYCASDVVRACEAIMEAIDKDLSTSDNFLKALDVLKRDKTEDLEKAVERAKLQLTAVVNQVQSFLDMNQIISAGPFLYALPTEGTSDVRFFAKPTCLGRLARFTLQAYCSVSKSKKSQRLPLVLATPLESERGTMLVVGIPPLSDTTCKNCLGKAFESAANSTNSRTLHDHFDTYYMEIKTEDKTKFFDALISLLQD